MELPIIMTMIFLLSGRVCGAPDNRGTEFIVGFMQNYDTDMDVEIFVTTSRTSVVDVQITIPRFTGVSLDQTFTVTAGEVKQIPIDSAICAYGTELSTKSIYITASDEVVVYGVNVEPYSNDAFLGFPVDVLGKEYYAVTHYPSEQPCELMIFGTEDKTQVTITYADNSGVSVSYDGSTYGRGATQTITLNRFDTYHAQTYGDLTGTHITADKRFALMSGNQRTNINPHSYDGSGGTRDTLVDQMMPVNTWGKEFGIVATPDRTTGDEIKFVGSEDGTSIRLECTDGTGVTLTVDSGTHAQYITPSDVVCHVLATKPIMVILFVVSMLVSSEPADPALITIQPFEQFAADCTFSTPKYHAGSYINYFMFVIEKAEIDGLRFNDQPLSSPVYKDIPNTDYVGGYINIPEGTHTIRHTKRNSVFGGSIFGRAYAESYGMPTGLRLAPINDPCTPTTSVLGDGIDNDCDGRIDEELCEVVTNVAKGKPATHSSLYNNVAGWDAEKAVDGNTDGNVYNYYCSITTKEYEPWWQVDLESLYTLTQVDIYDRLDCCTTRLRQVEISTGVSSGALSRAAYYDGVVGDSVSMGLSNVSARYVRVTLIGITEFLQLCEVEVYGFGDDDGDGTMDEDCAMPAPVHGGWSTWGAWSSLCYCTGLRPRERTCDNPAPQYDGNQCDGDAIENTNCQISASCAVDGELTQWSAWGSCSVTCGAGSAQRTRSCDPAPANGGKACDGALSDTQSCYTGSICPDCASNPCVNADSCTDGSTDYTCNCQTGWTGKTCDGDINECTIASPPCANGASCSNSQGDYTCTCNSAWQGKDCDQDVNECSSASPPCQNGATCSNSAGSYSCQCATGWNGTNCDIDINECTSASPPCANGASCSNSRGDYTCTCDSAWQGKDCDQDVNECTSVSPPCQNGATCTNSVGGYSCQCATGWDGTNCDIDINECTSASPPCQNGASCTNSQGDYTCTCDSAWQGKDCDQDVNECTIASPPCQNGATCTNSVGGYSCFCATGWNGTNCDIDINECTSASPPCQNGANCSNTQGDYTCTCATGWQSKDCDVDINECLASPCINGACINGPGVYSCDCDGGWTGTHCDEDIDECLSNPCTNNATCDNLLDDYYCNCTAGWEGKDCDIDINECDSSPCIQGTCNNLPNAYSCSCYSNYTGKNCEYEIGQPIDGAWSSWGQWQSCSTTCGTGIQKRYRGCDDPWPDYGGLPCPGDSYVSRTCTALVTCAPSVDGNWGAWSSVTSCSKTCGDGTNSKYRACDNPAPSNGGAECSGDQIVVSSCNDQDCDNNDARGGSYVSRCPSGYFTCQSGGVTCIQDIFVCDCYNECDDGSDELIPWAGDACNQICENAAPGLTMSLYMMLLLTVAMRFL